VITRTIVNLQRMTLYELERVHIGALTFDADGRWRRLLVRFAAWLLRRARATIDKPCVKYKVVTIHAETLLRALRLSQDELVRLWGWEASILIVGHYAAERLMAELLYTPFQTKIRFEMTSHGIQRILGMRVVVCPWLDGWLLLPDTLLKGEL
jgi:hypothetical protein